MADAPGSLHGFPASLTSFVGRARATREVAAQLAGCRLVTLTGPGGAGKTRLAGVVAKQVAGRFADGVWLAELAAVRDPAQVAATVAAALGLHDLPVVAAADALAHALARRQLLLVLDNCEQVIGAAAELCGAAAALRRRRAGAGHQPGAAAHSGRDAVPAGPADPARSR